MLWKLVLNRRAPRPFELTHSLMNVGNHGRQYCAHSIRMNKNMDMIMDTDRDMMGTGTMEWARTHTDTDTDKDMGTWT